MKSLKLKIIGMHCTSCSMNIDFDLEDLSGVKKAQTSYAREECIVEFDEKKVKIESLFKTIEKTGYSAKTIKI